MIIIVQSSTSGIGKSLWGIHKNFICKKGVRSL